MAIDEQLEGLAAAVEKMQEETAAFRQETRRGFQALTELHIDTRREMREGFAETNRMLQDLADAISALK